MENKEKKKRDKSDSTGTTKSLFMENSLAKSATPGWDVVDGAVPSLIKVSSSNPEYGKFFGRERYPRMRFTQRQFGYNRAPMRVPNTE